MEMEGLKNISFEKLKQSCEGFFVTSVSKNLSDYLFFSIPKLELDEKLKIKDVFSLLYMGTSYQYFNIKFQNINLNDKEKSNLLTILTNFLNKGIAKDGMQSDQEFYDAYIMLKLTIKKLKGQI